MMNSEELSYEIRKLLHDRASTTDPVRLRKGELRDICEVLDIEYDDNPTAKELRAEILAGVGMLAVPDPVDVDSQFTAMERRRVYERLQAATESEE